MTPKMRASNYLGRECYTQNSDVIGKVVKTDVFSKGIVNGESDIYLTVEWTSAGVIEAIVGDKMKFTLEEFEKRFTVSKETK